MTPVPKVTKEGMGRLKLPSEVCVNWVGHWLEALELALAERPKPARAARADCLNDGIDLRSNASEAARKKDVRRPGYACQSVVPAGIPLSIFINICKVGCGILVKIKSEVSPGMDWEMW